MSPNRSMLGQPSSRKSQIRATRSRREVAAAWLARVGCGSAMALSDFMTSNRGRDQRGGGRSLAEYLLQKRHVTIQGELLGKGPGTLAQLSMMGRICEGAHDGLRQS